MQRLRRLARRRSSRRKEDRFLIDGPVLVAEALRAGSRLEVLYWEPDADAALVARAAADGVEVVAVAEGSLSRVLDLVNPRSVVAVAHQRHAELHEVLAAATGESPMVLALVGLQDPGNAGTLIRVAEATGCAAVVLTKGAVDAWNPKVVRASAGSILRVPIVEGVESGELIPAARAGGLATLALTTTAGTSPDSLDLSGPVMLLVGSEPRGLTEEAVAGVDLRATIPMLGDVESLNAAVAGSLLAFEVARQRRHADDRSEESDFNLPTPHGPQSDEGL